jgi:succinate dehydrogenase/fumarate reductase flavoprotein subunit
MKQEKVHLDGEPFSLFTIQTIIVGSGAAGLNAAASLYKQGQRDIAIITEGKMMGTSRNTGSDKQTYYKLTTCSDEPDSVRQMAQTLFEGGCMDGDLALAEAGLSVRGFCHLVDIGVPFPHNGGGEYIGYKTDHDPFRRGTSAGPLTSKFMTESLWREVEGYGISVFDGYQVIEILTEQHGMERRSRGILALNKKAVKPEQRYVIFSAENIVYATGGEAGLYDLSVYPVSQTGGTGTALRAGARGKNLTESQYGIASIKFRWNLSGTYQQVIPRYISTEQDGSGEWEFLDEYFESPERLLYAIFLKGYQWPFDPRKTKEYGSSLIDILVYQETVIKGRKVFLDYQRNPSCSEKEGIFCTELLHSETYEYLKKSGGLQETPFKRLESMNPSAIELYKSHGIDLFQEKLEIAVCAQHNNGGLAGNWWWESNLKHFFPVGEVNGSHGVYRPGGSALNSGQVGGMRAAEYISNCYKEQPLSGNEIVNRCGQQIMSSVDFGMKALARQESIVDMKEERKKLGVRMSRYGAHIRSREGIKTALRENRAQWQSLETSGINNSTELGRLYRLRDLFFSQKAYLEAIEDYIVHGGKSRGSYLIYDENGEKPLKDLPECFRFLQEEQGEAKMIQELEYFNVSSRFLWRKARPIPEDDCWFENVWKKYREGVYFQGDSLEFP